MVEVFEMMKVMLTSIIVFFLDDPILRTFTFRLCSRSVTLSLYRPYRSYIVFCTAQFAYGIVGHVFK